MSFTPDFIKQTSKRSLSFNSVAVACLAAFFTLSSGASLAGPPSHAKGNPPQHAGPPLVLAEQGSFFVGGEIVFSEFNFGEPDAPLFGPGDVAISQMYVQFQVPKKKPFRYPVIMVHGGGHSGKTYETTPDGREGWFTSFTRRGFAPYVVDDPNRGRTCCESTQIHKVRLGLADPSTLPLASQTAIQPAWNLFRFGPEFPDPFPGVQFPVDLETVEQYMRQLVLSYRAPEELDKIKDGIVALLEEIGPAILMIHSQSGGPGLNAVLERPDLVKGFIAIEPSAFTLPSNGADALVEVPTLAVFGDFIDLSPFWPPLLAESQETVDELNAAGGDAMLIELPDVGINGNSHMMMMDKNSEEVADVIEQWIRNHVQGVRGR